MFSGSRDFDNVMARICQRNVQKSGKTYTQRSHI